MRSILFPAAFLFCFFLWTGEAAADPLEGETLKFSMTSAERYEVGKPVSICFTLENCSEKKVCVLTWYTPLEGIKGRIFKVSFGDETIHYQGRMIKRGNPARRDYICIDAGKSRSVDIDLAPVYNLSRPGEYRVEFKGIIHDIADDESSLPRTAANHQRLVITGNTITFTVIEPE